MRCSRSALEPGDEVETAAEDPVGRPRVESEIGDPLDRSEADLGERRVPLCAAPVVVRERNAVALVADSVHEAERRTGEEAVFQVVLDDDEGSRDATRLA